MAIRIYERQVGLQPLPGYRQQLRADPRAFGTAIGEGVVNLTRGLSQIAVKEIAKREDAALQTAYAQAVETRQSAESAFTQLQGVDAIDAERGVDVDPGTRAQQLFEKNLQDISGEIGSDRVKERFQRVVDSQSAAFRQTVNRHVARQSDQVFDDSNAAAQSLADQSAALAGADGANVRGIERAREEKLEAVESFIQHRGLDETAAEAYRKAAMTDLHTEAVQAMLDNDFHTAAEDYLSANRSEIDPTAVRHLKKGIKAASIKQRSADISRQISIDVTKEAKKADRRFEYDLAAANEKARNMPELQENAELADQVAARLLNDAKMADTERRVNDAEPFGRVMETLYSTGHLDKGQDFLRLSDEAQGTAERRHAGEWRARQAVGSRARSQQRERERDLMIYFHSLPLEVQIDEGLADSPAFADGGERLQNQIRAAQKKAVNEWNHDRGISRGDFLDGVFGRAAFEDYDVPDVKTFRADMLRRRAAWKAANPGLEPPPEVVDEMFGEAFVMLKKPWLWTTWGTEEAWRRGAALEVPPQPQPEPTPPVPPTPTEPTVPQAAQNEIRERFWLKEGYDPTQAQIETIYRVTP